MERIKRVFLFICILWIAACQKALQAQSAKGVNCIEFVKVRFSNKEISLLYKKSKDFNKPVKQNSIHFQALDEYCYKKIVVDTVSNYGLWEVAGRGSHDGSFFVIKSSEKLYFVRFIPESKYGQIDKDKTLHKLSSHFLKSTSLPDSLEKKIMEAISAFYR